MVTGGNETVLYACSWLSVLKTVPPDVTGGMLGSGLVLTMLPILLSVTASHVRKWVSANFQYGIYRCVLISKNPSGCIGLYHCNSWCGAI